MRKFWLVGLVCLLGLVSYPASAQERSENYNSASFPHAVVDSPSDTITEFRADLNTRHLMAYVVSSPDPTAAEPQSPGAWRTVAGLDGLTRVAIKVDATGALVTGADPGGPVTQCTDCIVIGGLNGLTPTALKVGSDGTVAVSGGSSGGTVFPVTVSGTVNSGGIPCFNSATNEESSAAIASGVLIKGGGAGACATTSSVTDNGSSVSTPEQIATSVAGAASTPAVSLTGAIFTGGTGTTTTPFIYWNNGASAPSGWNTSGTFFGANAASGFGGNFLDFHINGSGSFFNVTSAGALTAQGGIVGGSFQVISKSQFVSGSDGVWTARNNAGTGFSRFTIGPDSTSFPALCDNTGTTPYLALGVGGANCTSLSFVKTAQTLEVTGSDFTCTTGCTSLATVTGLSIALPTVSTNWSFDCNLVVSQATAAAANQIGVQTATNAPTNLEASAVVNTAAAVSTAGAIVGVSSTTSQSVVTFTPGAANTNMPIHLAGTIEGASASGTTFNVQVLTGSSSDALTIRRGSACWVY